MRISHIFMISATALILFSCVKEPNGQPNNGPGDGTATSVTLSLKSDRQTAGTPQMSPADALRAWNSSGASGIATLGTIPTSRASATPQE